MTTPFRFLFKLAVRLRYGRAGSHAFMWLPHLRLRKPVEGRSGEIFYRKRPVGRLLGSNVLAEAAGDTVYVIGSGPSIRGIDLSLIGERTAILLNGAISLLGEGLARPLAVAIEDERFIQRHFGMLKDRIGSDTFCLFSVPVLRAICETQPVWLQDKTIILIDNVRKPYAAPRPSQAELGTNPAFVVENDGKVGFSNDPDRGVFQGGSVAVSAMQFAVRCKPGTIGLLGIDISNANEPRFYENQSDMAKSGVARATDRIVTHLQLARRVAQSFDISVHNHSPVSVLREAGFGYDASLTAADGRQQASNMPSSAISGLRPQSET